MTTDIIEPPSSTCIKLAGWAAELLFLAFIFWVSGVEFGSNGFYGLLLAYVATDSLRNTKKHNAGEGYYSLTERNFYIEFLFRTFYLNWTKACRGEGFFAWIQREYYIDNIFINLELLVIFFAGIDALIRVPAGGDRLAFIWFDMVLMAATGYWLSSHQSFRQSIDENIRKDKGFKAVMVRSFVEMFFYSSTNRIALKESKDS